MRLVSTILLMLIGLVPLGRPAAAQGTSPAPLPSFRLAPVVGYSLGIAQRGLVTVSAEGVPFPGSFEAYSEGGMLGGVTMELPMRLVLALPALEGVSLTGSLAYGRHDGGTTTLRVQVGQDAAGAPDSLRIVRDQRGTEVLLAKLGVALRVPVTLPTTLTLAPALVQVSPRHHAQHALDRTGTARYPGFNVGLAVDLPTTLPGLALRLAAEDFATLPNPELAERVDRLFAADYDVRTQTRLSNRVAHLLLLQAGLSLSF